MTATKSTAARRARRSQRNRSASKKARTPDVAVDTVSDAAAKASDVKPVAPDEIVQETLLPGGINARVSSGLHKAASSLPLPPWWQHFMIWTGRRSAAAGASSSLLFWSFVALVVLAPLPMGAVQPWSWGLMSAGVGVMLCVWAARAWLGQEKPWIGLTTTWPLVLLFAVTVIWIVIQGGTASPGSWHHPLWEIAGTALGRDLAGRVTLDPGLTWAALTRLAAYAGIFWLAFQLCGRASRASRALHAVVFAGLAYAAYGLIVEFSGSQSILWYAKVAYQDDLTSTFVNRNSYATYAGLALICAAGLMMARITRTLHGPSRLGERIRELLVAFDERGSLLVLAAMTLIAALVFTNSRAGVMSALVGLVVLVAAWGAARMVRPRTALTFGGSILVVLVLGFAVGGGTLGQRLADSSIALNDRASLYNLTLDAIDAAPYLGGGYGAYEHVFRMYRDPGLRTPYTKAHNTYLENAAELGIPAAALLVVAVGGVAAVAVRGVIRRRRDMEYPCIGVAATALVATHSTLDFSLQIPAVTATYCLIMGVACAQSWSSRRAPDRW